MSKKRNTDEEKGGSKKGKGKKKFNRIKKMSHDKNYLPPSCYKLYRKEKLSFCELRIRWGTHPT